MKYETTHPWIKFAADYRHLAYTTWIRLGEVQSKCEHIANVPLLPAVADHLHELYLAKGVLATTAIEGNTLTEEQVRQRIEGTLSLPPSQEYLGKEVDNVLAACNLIGQWVFAEKITQLTVQNIKEFNRLVLADLPLNEGVVPGEIRPHAVTVGRYLGAPAEDCEYLLERFCTWLNEMTTTEKDHMLFGILKAIYAHVYFAWIHPFADGNGRTARLIEFQILLSSGVPTAAAHLLSNHYNLTRTEYYRQLERTSTHEYGIDDFISYALQGLVDGLREQINVIRSQQLIVHWRDYVYDYFRDKETVTARRQRRLVLDMTTKYDEGALPLDKIRHVSTRIAEEYAGKKDKTVQRDLEALVKAGLLKRMKKGYRANLSLMLAFRPSTVLSDSPPAK